MLDVREAGSQLADIGCGLGHWSRLLYPYLRPPAWLAGVDREPRWVAEAPEKFHRAFPNVAPELFSFHQGDATKLPLARRRPDDVVGVAVGFAELPADAWLVQHTRTLDYSVRGGPMLWCSPAWMPLAWQVVAVQFGYLGLRLRERFGGRGIAHDRRTGALQHPLLRRDGPAHPVVDLQRLQDDFVHAYYIVLGEFGIAIALALLATKLGVVPWRTAILTGLLGGPAMTRLPMRLPIWSRMDW